MVKNAFFRANIPFTTTTDFDFQKNIRKEGWNQTDIQGSWLLKHINTSFGKNVVCHQKQISNIFFNIPECHEYPSACEYKFAIDEVYAFCFDTGVGIISMNITCTSPIDENSLANVCSVLRCSAEHKDSRQGKAIVIDGKDTYLSCVAQTELETLLGDGFTLFDQFNDNSLKRVDMFSVALCDVPTEDDSLHTYDKLCYRLANALDTRDKKLILGEENFYRHFEYTRWSFSQRGCAVVSNLTEIPSTDGFLQNRWLFSVKSNYFYIYLMVLHQKYAIYNYLNTVAADAQNTNIHFNQESLIDFNSKYVFAIVSDEPLIQTTYMKMKAVNNVDAVYADLLDELKRMFEYSQLKSNELNEIKNNRLNILSLSISALCSISIIFETINLFTTRGYTWGFGSKASMFYTGTVIFEIIAFVACLAIVFCTNKRKH